MPFVPDGRTLIADAYARGYTLPAFNVCSAEMVRACLEAAAAEGAPVIVQTYPDDIAQLPPAQMTALVRSFAEASPVPVALHLDHGRSFEMALACLRAGYGSVMYDGAGEPLETLISETRRLAEIAHAQGAALEVAAESFDRGASALTRPDDARILAEAGADMVAVSVGSEHGRQSELDLERLERLAEAVAGPLVLHGGSGVAERDLAAARRFGVVKLNIGSALYRALRRVWEGSSDARSHREVYARVRAALAEVAREKFRATGANGQA